MIEIPKGTKDVLPSEAYKWHHIENIARDVARVYNIHEVRTPVFEHTELFVRSVGETTDVVNKEMYTFLDKGERSITLKPEGTAGVARCYVGNGLFNESQPIKMFYFTPVFRYEKPQAGRLREHHQFGVEFYGASNASIDAEVISVAKTMFDRLGIKNLTLCINSIGCPECRKNFNDALKKYLKSNLDKMCPTCNERFEKNPLRIIDCKQQKCSEINAKAPIILDYICDACNSHFNELQGFLNALNIPFEIDPTIVRGLDYYSKTVFEFVSKDIGAKSTVCGGGRYDGLIENVGGKPTACVGFGMGLERLLLVLESQNIQIENTEIVDAYVICASKDAYQNCYKLTNTLRQNGISCDIDHLDRSFKAQLKFANKINAKNVIIVGEDEIAKGVVQFKNMQSGEQLELSQNQLIEKLTK